MMTPLTAIRRLLASGALLTGALVFAWMFGPRPTPVHADIYARLASTAGFMPAPPGEGTTLRHGKVHINGMTFNYVVGHSKQSVESVLAHYEQQFETVDAAGRKLSSATRLQANGAGVVAGMHFGRIVHPTDMTERAGNFATTGRLSALAEFHLISAYKQRGTVFIDFTPAPDVTVQSLVPPAGQDAPGDDLAGVARPRDLQRLFSIEHGDGGDWSRTLIYRAAHSRQAVDEFRRSFAAAGWTSNPLFDTEGVAHLSDGRRECFLAGGGDGTNSVVILVHRNLPSAGQKR